MLALLTVQDRITETRARRFETSTEATLGDGDIAAGGRIVDITVRGARFEGTDAIAQGRRARLTVSGLSCNVRIAWARDGACGLEFTDPYSQTTLNLIRRAMR